MLRIDLLGPLRAERDGVEISIGPAKQRQLLALLALADGEVVTADSIIDRLWDQRPPASAPHAVQVYISAVRKALGGDPSPIEHIRDRAGYRLVDVDSDVAQFERLVAEGDPEAALALWRGTPYEELSDDPDTAAAAALLEQRRLDALEQWQGQRVDQGASGAVEDLTELVDSNPYRERFTELLMLALYRAGRQVEALASYQALRSRLIEELGVEPGPAVRRLEAQILEHSPELDSPTTGEDDPVAADDSAEPAASASRSPEVGRSDISKSGEVARDEQRTVTALFCDLVGSTPLGEALQPDEFKLVVDGAVARATDTVHRYGGQVIGVAGDGVCAVFGAGVTYEDDPERAVRAAAEIADRLETHAHEVANAWNTAPPLARVGVHTGPVALGRIGGGALEDLTALGDTMNVASRIESNAEPGTVLVSTSTAALCGPGITWSDARQLTVKGRAQPVEVVEIAGVDTTSTRRRGLPGLTAPILGRVREVDAVRHAVHGLMDGRGAIVCITGPAGHGKSRLVDEAHSAFQNTLGTGAHWIAATCASFLDAEPFSAIRAALRDWFDLSDTATLRARLTVQRRLEELADSGVDIDDEAVLALLGVGGDATIDSDRMVAAVEDLIGALVAEQPVAVVIDDLHWSDPSTLDIARRLLTMSARWGLLLVLAMRPETDSSAWALVDDARRQHAHRCTDLRLDALGPEDMGRLLDSLIGAGTLSPDGRQAVIELADGVPFYLEEIVRTMISDGVLTVDENSVLSTGARVDLARGLPSSVEQVVVSRFSRLSSQARTVASAAAILGDTFAPPILAEVSNLSTDDVDTAIEEVLTGGFIVEHGRWPSLEYQFIHALARTAIARTLTSARRMDVHRRALQHLESILDPVEGASELATHAEGAHDLAKALEYRLLAAVSAEYARANQEAETHYEAAVSIAERTDAAGIDQRLLAEALCGLGRVRILIGAEGRPVLRQAVAVAAQCHDPALEQEAAEQLALAEMINDYAASESVLDRVVELARERGDARGEVHNLSRRSLIATNRGDLVLAETLTDRGLDIARRNEDEDLLIQVLDARKLHLGYQGDFQAQRAVLDRMDSYCEEHDEPFFRPYACAERALAFIASGDLDAARQALADAEAIAVDDGHTLAVHFSQLWAVWVHVLAGRLGDARDLHTRIEVGEGALMRAWWGEQAVRVDVATGHFDQGLARAEELYARARAVGTNAQALLAAAVLTKHETEQDTGTDWHDRLLHLLDQVRAPGGSLFLYAWDAYAAAAEGAIARGNDALATQLGTQLADAARAAGWADALAAAQLVLARCTDGPARHELATQAAATAEASGVSTTRWRAQLALATTTPDRARALRHLTNAQTIVDQLADSLPQREDRSVYIAHMAEHTDRRLSWWL